MLAFSIFLVVLVGIGMALAMRRAPIWAWAGFFLAAAIVFAFIVSVARAHAPLGVFATGRVF